jgi:hypothetical protein
MQNEETREIVSVYFSTLPMAILTLMQFATADSISSIYLPICREEPLFVVYFLTLWLVVTVALMNMVTAVIVETAMAQSVEDAEERLLFLRLKIKKMGPDIEAAFDKLDADGRQHLSLQALEEAAHSGDLRMPDDIQDLVDPAKLVDLFGFLDTNMSGEISRSEFIHGIKSLVMSEVPIETTQILELSRHTHHIVNHIARMARLEVPLTNRAFVAEELSGPAQDEMSVAEEFSGTGRV